MKKAFTLAEMLISIVIIGVIASIMMSAVNKVNPDENVLLYKKAFFTIQEAVSVLINDSTKYGDTEDLLKRRPENTGAHEEADVLYLCQEMAGVLNTIGTIDCSKSATTNFTLSNGATISGIKGTFANADINNYIEDHIDICVDANGDEAPNEGCETEVGAIKNRDRFRIRLYYNGKVTTSSNWKFENAILQSGAKNLKFDSTKYAENVK